MALAEHEVDADEGLDQNRQRRGLKLSKPSHNVEGRSERDLQAQNNLDKGVSSKLKKRRRKDLSVADVECIVASASKPYNLLKDVALQYRLTPSLVGRLVKEADAKPDLLDEQRERE